MSDRPHYGSPVAARLNELEDENQRLRDVLDRIASALVPLDVTIDHSLYVGSTKQMSADLVYIRQLLVDARRDIGETLAAAKT